MKKIYKHFTVCLLSLLMFVSLASPLNTNAKVNNHTKTVRVHKSHTKQKLFPLEIKTRHRWKKLYHDPFTFRNNNFNTRTYRVIYPTYIEQMAKKNSQPNSNLYVNGYIPIKRNTKIRLELGISGVHVLNKYINGHKLIQHSHGYSYKYQYDTESDSLYNTKEKINKDKSLLNTKEGTYYIHIYHNLLKQKHRKAKLLKKINI